MTRKNEPIDTFKVKCSACGSSISIEDTFDPENGLYFCNKECRDKWQSSHSQR